MTPDRKDIAASVQAKLLQRSRESNVEHQLTLARFGGERLLYRLAQSEFADRFILKGAALLLLWLGDAIRPTRDLDLLAFGDASADALKEIFTALCRLDAPEDGLTFLTDTIHLETIRDAQEYGGMRVTLLAMLGKVRIPLQIDVGTGDAVVPPPETIEYPGLIALPRARVHVYRPETAIAEKTEAMVRLALANSRMKDLFDVYSLAMTHAFEGATLRAALGATFRRRSTQLPVELPIVLSSEFAGDVQKQRQWDAFIRRVRVSSQVSLGDVVKLLRDFLWPAIQAATQSKAWSATWEAGGPWNGTSDTKSASIRGVPQ